MQKYVVANSKEDFEKFVAEKGEELEGAIYLDDPAKLFQADTAQLVIAPGAEEHPVLDNWRVKKLRNAPDMSWSRADDQAGLEAAQSGSGVDVGAGHERSTAEKVGPQDTNDDPKVEGDAFGDKGTIHGLEGAEEDRKSE